MQLTSRLIRISSIALLLSGCASQRPTDADGPAHVLSAFVSALNDADINAITNLFAPDATAFLPLESEPVELIGREAIRTAILPLFHELRLGTGPPYMHLVAKDVHVQAIGALAVVTFNAGSGPVVSRRTLVIQNTPSGWQITHFHGSNVRKSTTGAGA